MDPFHIEAPAILNVSGGRTSALMLRRYLDAFGGRLPPGVYAVFANTGDERPETLDFLHQIAVRWGVDLRWIERDSTAPEGFREVTYETASRHAEPFEELITERQFLPHHGARFCTQELKIEAARAFMRSEGHEHWTSAVGLRADEPHRAAKRRARLIGGGFVSQNTVILTLLRAGLAREDASGAVEVSPEIATPSRPEAT